MAPAPIALRCGDLSLDVDVTRGGRASSLRFDGVELLGGKSEDPVEYGMYPMGPWAGRLQGNELRVDGRTWPMSVNYQGWALHGTVLDRPWVVVGLAQESDHSWLAITTDLGETWPWRGSMELTWSLHRSVLRTSLIVRAHDSQFPAVIGMHPWLLKDTAFGEAQWQMSEAELAAKGADFSLTGELRSGPHKHGGLDDSFRVLDGRARVDWGSALSLEIHQSHQWFVVYDSDPEFLCVEPQTGPTDGVNDGFFGRVAIVTPGRPLTQQTAWSFIRA